MARKTTDLTHLQALEAKLSHERSRLTVAKSSGEKILRSVWVRQIEKEVAAERAFLHINNTPATDADLLAMTDDELSAALA